MSILGTISPRYQLTGTNRADVAISKDRHNDSLVVDSAAGDGAAMVRDRAKKDGWGFDEANADVQAAIDACPEGGTVRLSRARSPYRIAVPLTITKALMIEGQQAEIQQLSARVHGLTVTASGVTIRDLRITGTQHATQAANQEAGIRASGASAAEPLTDLTIESCTIRNFGDYGVSLEWVTDFQIIGNRIRDVFYAGVMGVSVQRGRIQQNTITHIIGTTVTNAYGISVTRIGHASLTLWPRSSDVDISGNHVSDVPGWEGIDAHAGQRLTIRGNIVTGCHLGISVGSSVVDGVETYGSIDCVISGNVVDSNVTDGSAMNGIQLLGAGDVAGSPRELATGAITGNVIRGHGRYDSMPGNGGIMIRNTQGVTVSGNTLIEPSPYGINCWYNNFDFAISGNTVLDVFSDTVAVNQAVAIYLRGGGNRGLISGNVLARGAKLIGPGLKAFTHGIVVATDLPLLPWVLGPNLCTGQTGVALIDIGAARVLGLGQA